MEPALREGDWLLMLPPRRASQRGDVVLFRDPRESSRLLLKRVVDVRDGALVVEGDHRAHSTDSRHFGAVDPSEVIARAAFRYAPLNRIGPVRG
jgi:hypothetical protein